MLFFFAYYLLQPVLFQVIMVFRNCVKCLDHILHAYIIYNVLVSEFVSIKFVYSDFVVLFLYIYCIMSVLGEGSLLCGSCWVFFHFLPPATRVFLWIVFPYMNQGSQDGGCCFLQRLQTPLRHVGCDFGPYKEKMTWLELSWRWTLAVDIWMVGWQRFSVEVFLELLSWSHDWFIYITSAWQVKQEQLTGIPVIHSLPSTQQTARVTVSITFLQTTVRMRWTHLFFIRLNIPGFLQHILDVCTACWVTHTCHLLMQLERKLGAFGLM